MKAAFAMLAVALASAPAWAQDAHKMTLPKDLKWEAVPSLPKGAQIAVIEGSMSQAAPFTIRLKFPANYRIPPHHHPAVERVTVLSGTFNMGIGEKFDQKATHSLPRGGVMIMQPKTPHFAWNKDEVVVQLHGTGPWGVTYVNPKDDPRKQQ
jgi:quercetin dioxygenase-like cupin family protein